MVDIFGEGRSMRVPLDGRFGVAVLWGVALGLLVIDTLDDHLSIVSAWAFAFGGAGALWFVALLFAYSRKVVLEVMSWEHRQIMDGDGDDTKLRIAGQGRQPKA